MSNTSIFNDLEWTRDGAPSLHLYALGHAPLRPVVSCDMKLHSVLLGGAILTKPCVCPQVLHGSMRVTGGPGVGATVRGVKPSR